MDAQVYFGDGSGPVWAEQVRVCTLTPDALSFFSPRPEARVAVGDELILREASGAQRRVRVSSVLGQGTFFFVRLLL